MIRAAATIIQPGLQPRTNSTDLSYDYIFDRSACGDFSPVILDTDSELRWVSPQGTQGALIATSTFFDNAIYVTQGPQVVPHRT